nr:MAG TPA: hypothetical protein [Caudoviricetes sp.]
MLSQTPQQLSCSSVSKLTYRQKYMSLFSSEHHGTVGLVDQLFSFSDAFGAAVSVADRIISIVMGGELVCGGLGIKPCGAGKIGTPSTIGNAPKCLSHFYILLGCAPLDYITYYTPIWCIVKRKCTNLGYFLRFVELHKTGGGFCALCHSRRMQAESGQFDCPDFLYHGGSKEVRYGILQQPLPAVAVWQPLRRIPLCGPSEPRRRAAALWGSDYPRQWPQRR